MIKKMRKQLKNEKGLTLVELLAVIVILGIIAAIAIPAIGNIIKNSQVGAMKSDNLNAISAAEMFLLDNPGHSGEVTLKKHLMPTEGISYLDDAGSFDESGTDGGFKYKDGEVTSKATKGKITLSAEGATKKDFNAFKNSDRTTDDKKITVTEGSEG